jgi:sulfur carrier protein
MKVNGENITLGQPVSLKEFLESAGYITGHVAVERNGDIVPKLSYDSVMLTEADTLEIVHFVGGG